MGTSYFDLLRLLPENVPVLLQLLRGFGPRLPGQHVPQFHIQLLLFLRKRQEEELLLNSYGRSTACEKINLTENCNSVRKVFGETNLPVCQAFLTSHKVFKVVVIAVGELIKRNIQLLQTTNEMLLNTIASEHALPQQLLEEYPALGN